MGYCTGQKYNNVILYLTQKVISCIFSLVPNILSTPQNYLFCYNFPDKGLYLNDITFLGVLHVIHSHYFQVPPSPPCHWVKSDSQFCYTCPSHMPHFVGHKFSIYRCIWVKYNKCKVLDIVILYFCHIDGNFGVK